MAQTSTILVQTPIQCSPDMFYNFFKAHAHLLEHACRSVVLKIELDKENKSWSNVIGSRKKISIVTSPDKPTEVIKTQVVAMDDGSRKITYKVLEGPPRESYSSFQVTLEVTADSFVKWTLEYVKKDATIGEPGVYTGLFPTINYSVSAYLLSNPI